MKSHLASDDAGSPYAKENWLGQACWTTLSVNMPDGSSARQPDLSALVLSVPNSMHKELSMRAAHCTASWRKWQRVGTVVLRTSSHVAIGVLDVAGHELVQPKAAASEGRLYVMPVAEEVTELTPLVPIHGFRDMCVEAAAVHRLSAREFTQSFNDLRAGLRQSDVFSDLIHFDQPLLEQQLDTLTIAACVLAGR